MTCHKKEDECPGCPERILNPDMLECICSCLEPGKIDHAIFCVCGLCGCGSSRDSDLLLEVLIWCDLETRPKEDKGTYRSAAWELAAKILDANDLVEHGSGIGWPWTTEKGKAFLEWHKKYTEVQP